MMALPPPIPHTEAQARLLAMAAPLGTEIVPTAEASGRFLAQPVLARRTQPAADLSAMDGYAVRGDDCAGPWVVVGESAAGHPFTRRLGRGEAVRISTGAMLPEGAGAVLLEEDARLDGKQLARAGSAMAEQRHVRRAGFDFREGAPLLEAGTLIGPTQLALAIAGGHATLAVGRRPVVALLDCGDELSADPAMLAPHQIPASNGAMLAAMVAPLAAQTLRLGPVADRMAEVLAALEAARAADVLVTSGGASVGDHDLIRPALEQAGAQLAFWRIALRPGKPLLLARRERQIILGLPGNPASSLVTAVLFVLPLLRALAGAARPLPQPRRMALLAALTAGGRRVEFLRARIEPAGVTPISERDSSALLALAQADALIERPVDAPAAAAGELVNVYPLPTAAMA